MEKLIDGLEKLGVYFAVERTIKLEGRSLQWEASCSFNDVEFVIESDGPHHFSALGVTQVSRECPEGGCKAKRPSPSSKTSAPATS